MHLTQTYDLDTLAATDNIAEILDERDLGTIGLALHNGFEIDENSRADWLRRNADAMKLALQVVEKKSFPWPNASNVKYPLVTLASLQFHSRAYPQLVSGTDIVRMRVVGHDPDGSKSNRAHRVGAHMSFQVLEEDEDWEEEMDKVLIHTPIVGCSFKKTYFNRMRGHNQSEFIPANALVVNYYAKSLEYAQRVTHVLELSKNDVYERMAAGMYLSTELDRSAQPVADTARQARDKGQGLTPPAHDPEAPIEMLEMHTFLDLDGDGYQEPYIVTFRRDNKQVLRIQARFLASGIKRQRNKVIKIKAENYFTKFPFIPSPDGGFYDIGFGSLLGPINESINSIINQLVDAGTMANTAGGFLSRGIKLRGGNYTFAPLEWKHVDTTGDDLRKGIMPLPVREPSDVLFKLLSLLIDSGQRIGMSVDILVGENPGQNTPASTSQMMAEQGMKIFNGIYKRTYRSLRDEFRKWYRLNQLNVSTVVKFGSNQMVTADDYTGPENDVVPAADPNIVSDQQRLMIATAIKQASMGTPGYDKYQVEKMYLEAMKVPNIDVLFPDPKGPNAQQPIPNPKLIDSQAKQMVAQAKMEDVKTKAKLKAAELMQKAGELEAKMDKLKAETVAIMAGVDQSGSEHILKQKQYELQAAEFQHKVLHESAKMLVEMYNAETERKEAMNGGESGGNPAGG